MRTKIATIDYRWEAWLIHAYIDGKHYYDAAKARGGAKAVAEALGSDNGYHKFKWLKVDILKFYLEAEKNDNQTIQ